MRMIETPKHSSILYKRIPGAALAALLVAQTLLAPLSASAAGERAADIPSLPPIAAAAPQQAIPGAVEAPAVPNVSAAGGPSATAAAPEANPAGAAVEAAGQAFQGVAADDAPIDATLQTLARRFDNAASQGDSASLDDWMGLEAQKAHEWMFANISAPGTLPGTVLAAQDHSNPEYDLGYHWVRDAGLVMKVVANLHRQAVVAYKQARTEEDKRKFAERRDFYFNRLMEFANASRIHQTNGSLSDLGEPKHRADGSAFKDPWGRPQNDSPAARALALITFANTLLMEGRRDIVQGLLYKPELPARTVIKADLEYVAHHFSEKSFDAWEEVYVDNGGSHFYNAMVQRRAMLEGAELARKVGDAGRDGKSGAVARYEQAAADLTKLIERHWNKDLGLVVTSIKGNSQPGADGGKNYKDSHLDSIVEIAAVRGNMRDGFFGPTDDRMQATLHKAKQRFKEIYKINQLPNVPGVAIGRYPEDELFGGNAWVISTLGFGEFYSDAARDYTDSGRIAVTELNLPFFQDLKTASADKLHAGMTIHRKDAMFVELISGLKAAAEAQVARVRYHTDRNDGSWSEEIDRNTGLKRSAEKLTWNSAAYLRLLDNLLVAKTIDPTILRQPKLGQPITRAVEKIHFAIEGAGDVVRLYIGPALEALVKNNPDREIKATFIDNSAYWRNDPVRVKKMEAVIAYIKSWGGEYLDVAGMTPEQADEARRALNAHVIDIENPDVAHVGTTIDWLNRYGGAGPQILVDKPLSNNVEEAFMLLGALVDKPGQVHGIDHFLAMALPTPEQRKRLDEHLGGGLAKQNFYLVENHSAGDPLYKTGIDDDGAIEREGRTNALKNGLVLDLLSHGLPMVAKEGDINSVEVKWVRAAQYKGAGGDPEAKPGIPATSETFAEVGFTFHDKQGHIVKGTATIGKGLRGVKALGPQFDHQVFALEEVGLNGNRVVYNMRPQGDGAGKAHLYDSQGNEVGSYDLPTANPYYRVFESLIDGVSTTNGIVFPVETAQKFLEIMDRIRIPIRRQKDLATYNGGMRGGRQADYVEDVQGGLIWGHRPADW